MLITGLREARRERLEKELARMTEELIHLGAEKVILFGSLARGKTTKSSDLDLIVVMPSEQPFLARWEEVYVKLLPGVDTDLLVYTPEEFEEKQQTSAAFRHKLKDGKVLYAAGS